MKLEIYKPKEEIKTEKPVRLALEQFGESVAVIAVDENGQKLLCGNLIIFSSDGIMSRYCEVNKNIGFNLDSAGKIKEV